MTYIDIIVPADQAEGTKFTLRSWLKAPGSTVTAEEPIAEIETDKVTMEVPAPAAGALGANLVAAGTAVQPGQVIGAISVGEAAATAEPAPREASPISATGAPARAFDPELRLSPSVRRLLSEHRCDPAAITGTGRGGRITRDDVEAYVRRGTAPAEAAKPVPVPATAQAPSPSRPGSSRKIPHDSMRRAIAEHMQRSVSTAPHVTAVFEADFSAIARDREKKKAEFQRRGVALTYTAYFVAACVSAIQKVPQVNSRWHENEIEIFDDINIGIGTALGDKGLVVPVVRRAQDLSLEGIAERLTDLTARARAGQLKPADLQGGTFTISNHGTSGSLVATPIIINQPQSAILGVGKLEKRVAVRALNGNDTIVILPMAYVSLTIDHRVLDGHQTNTFLSAWVEAIEGWG